MLLWRKFEDKLAEAYIQQKVRGFLHLYNGQEAVLAGCMHAIEIGRDKMISSYRSHPHAIALGMDPKKVMAELFGKSSGTSNGLGGSMHIFSKKHGFYGGHGIVGGQIPLGAGIAFAEKYHKRNGVVLTFIGDGAVWQGTFHETLNLSGVWKLPVVFIIENNRYAMGTSIDRSASNKEVWELGIGYDIPCEYVDGMDPVAVAKSVDKAVTRARRGEGPSLLEVRTYRYRGHSMSDAQLYRTKEEVASYKKIDPITKIRTIIEEEKYASESELDKIDKEVKETVQVCYEFSDNEPLPEENIMYNVVYEQSNYPFLSHK